MNRDLEEQVNEMGPDYRAVVARLRAAREAETGQRTADNRQRSPSAVLCRPSWLLAAASFLLCLGVSVVWNAGNPTIQQSNNPPREYVMTVPEMIASQNPDGSWKNDFLTRRNAEALRCCGGVAAQVAYKRAVRNLRSKGLL